MNRAGGLTHTVHLILDDWFKTGNTQNLQSKDKQTKRQTVIDFLQLIQTPRWICYGLVTVQSHKTFDKKCKLKTVHWLYIVGNLTANTWASYVEMKKWDKRPYSVISSSVSCHAPTQDKVSTKKVSWIRKLEPKCNKPGGFKTRLRQTLRVQSQTITLHWISETRSSGEKHLNVFISKWVTDSDNKKISMLWLSDGHRRVRGFNKKEGPLLTPGSTITLTTGMAADLKPKSLRLIGVTQTRCTAPNCSRVNAAANIIYCLWFIQHVIT